MKLIIHRLLSALPAGGLTITYPDQTTHLYGDKKAARKLHVVFKTHKALRQFVWQPSLAIGEGYMREDIVFQKGGFEEAIALTTANKAYLNSWFNSPIAQRLMRRNIRRRQQSYIAHHYDIGNDFYKLWLDKSLTYSCAYFHKQNDSLEKAQQQKVAHILRKLNLGKGQRLLDIGSGWGTLLITAAREYGVYGHGITLSREQLAHSQAAATKAGVDHLVKLELANYQDLPTRGKQYDRIVSVGMFEHVGAKNMPHYFAAVSQLLKPGGITVLHTITTPDYHGGCDPWIEKYIFPGGYIPAVREIANLYPRYGFSLIDYENLRLHYALTLDEWLRRYEKHRAAIIKEYGEEFYRMWYMYLACCAANFRHNGIDLSQFIFVKGYSNSLPLTRDYLYPAEKVR